MFSHFLKKFYTSLYGYAATGEERYEADLKLHLSYLESIDLKVWPNLIENSMNWLN